MRNALWWIGLIRRLHTDAQGTVHVGIEILAKKPLSVWLRTLGKESEKVSNWETSSGSFDYDYLPVILLPDANNSYANATMLIESGVFVQDTIYEMMMGGEKPRHQALGPTGRRRGLRAGELPVAHVRAQIDGAACINKKANLAVGLLSEPPGGLPLTSIPSPTRRSSRRRAGCR